MKCKFEHDDDCCNSGSPQYMCKCKPDVCHSAVPMTNADRIRSMSDEELSDFAFEVYKAGYDDAEAESFGERKCSWIWSRDWFRQPAEEN